MLSRTLLQRAALAPRAAWRPAPTRLLASKATETVVDKEANRESMEQANKQMEDVIVKEKEVHENEQVEKAARTWDAAAHGPVEPGKETRQSKTQEMDAIFDEQVALARKGMLHGQNRGSPDQYTEYASLKEKDRRYAGADDDSPHANQQQQQGRPA